MKLFVYSMLGIRRETFFDQFCRKYGVEYGYTVETPCLDNIDLARGYDG